MSPGNNKKYRKGFGIVEVLLAGVIIITVLGALVVVARTTVNNTIYLKQRTVAYSYAQSLIETIRQIRDTNYIDNRSDTEWNNFVGDNNEQIPVLGKEYCVRKKLTNPDGKAGNVRFRIINCSNMQDPDDPSSISDNGIISVDDIDFTSRVKFLGIGDLLTDPIGIEEANRNAYRAEITVSWVYLGRDYQIVVKELIANSRQQW